MPRRTSSASRNTHSHRYGLELPPGASPLGTQEIALPTVLPQIPEEAFARLCFHVDETGRRLVAEGGPDFPNTPGYFETLTALAFLYFADARPGGSFGDPVDIAILEVGLPAGGWTRPTSSNLSSSVICGRRTRPPGVSRPHHRRHRAREGRHPPRPGSAVVTLPQHPEANQAIGEVAAWSWASVASTPPNTFPAATSAHQPHLQLPPFMRDRRGSHGWDENSPLVPNHYNLSIDGETIRIRSPLPRQKHQQLQHRSRNLGSNRVRNGISYKIKIQITQSVTP